MDSRQWVKSAEPLAFVSMSLCSLFRSSKIVLDHLEKGSALIRDKVCASFRPCDITSNKKPAQDGLELVICWAVPSGELFDLAPTLRAFD